MSKVTFNNNCTNERHIICRNRITLTNLLIILLIIYSLILREIGHYGVASFLNCIGLFALASSITNWFALQIMMEKLSFLFTIRRIRSYLFPLKSLLINDIFSKKNYDKLKEDFNNNKYNIILKENEQEKIKEKIHELELVNLLLIFNQTENARKMEESIFNYIYGIEDDLKAKITEGLIEERKDKTGFIFFNEEILPIIENRIEAMIVNLQCIVNGTIRDYFRWLVLWGAFCGMGFGAIIYAIKCFGFFQ